MSLSSIASKLRALRALAEDSRTPEHERLSATAKYEELLHKYHLDASEIDLREEGTEHVVIEFGLTGNAWSIARVIGPGIRKFCHTKQWLSARGTYHVLGLKSDAQFAEWLFRSIVSHIQGEALAYSLDAAAGDFFAGDLAAFCDAAARRVRERLEALAAGKSEGTDTALVVVRSKMIDEAFDALGIGPLYANWGTAPVSGRANAINAGAAAGNRAGFARPAGYTQTLRISK